MSLALWTTIASVGTFIVIAATAIAAVIQLRHMRSSNQIAALNEIRETLESPPYRTAVLFVADSLPELLKDPVSAARLRKQPLDLELQAAGTVANFFENLGTLVKHGIIGKSITLDLWASMIALNWERLAPFIALRRRLFGRHVWENFEYLTVLAQDYLAAHPGGSYPPGVRRIPLDAL